MPREAKIRIQEDKHFYQKKLIWKITMKFMIGKMTK